MTDLGPYRFGAALRRHPLQRALDAKMAGDFSRADVLIEGVDHSGPSFEALLFANNDGADAATPRDDDHGYLGKFDIFGHGFCFGDAGHCQVNNRGKAPTDLRGPHPLTPTDVSVVVTEPLRRLLAKGRTLSSITFVPIAIGVAGDEAAAPPEILRYKSLRVVTYA